MVAKKIYHLYYLIEGNLHNRLVYIRLYCRFFSIFLLTLSKSS